MAFEIPLDQIKELQLLLRKEVSLSWYEPQKEDPFTLPKLPSVAETIAKLDPSPPYLRCKHCKGKLLRGVQSSICVFCGTNPHKDLPPDSIKFKDTVGYRFLLDSFQLDGSEMVAPVNKGNDSSRVRRASKEEIPLSELLDLEIIRPSELDGLQTRNSDEAAFQSKGSLNLAAVDLDSFFSQTKSASDAFEDQLGSKELVDSATDKPLQTSENLSLFQNVLVQEKTTGPEEGQSSNSFSGWEADFQHASSEAIHKESKSFDHYDVDLDEVFGFGDASLGVKKNDSSNPSASVENDWFQGDMQRSSEVTSQTGKPEVEFEPSYSKMGESARSSTRNLDWMQAGQGQESQNKTTDNVITDEAAHSLDDWDGFTGSVSTQDPSSGVSNSKITSQTGEAKMNTNLNDTKAAEANHSSSTKNYDWMQDDDNLWRGSNDKTTNTVPTDEVTDSINAWNDFIGPAGTQDPSNIFPKSVMASQTERSEITADLSDRKVVESNNNFDWMEDDLWQGSYHKTTDTLTTEEVSDSFDDWNGLTSSASTQDPSVNVWKQTLNQTSYQQTPEIDAFSLPSNSDVINFGGFKHHNLFSEPFSDPLSSVGANIQTGASSGRVASVDATGGNSGDVSNAKVGSNADDVEMLLSQMHDLSFMLESELSVPPK